jgi:hypothetical protein
LIRKTIIYKDFDGVQQSEDHWFHLFQRDIVRLQISETGGLGDHLKSIVESGNSKLIMEKFEEILRSTHGVREGGKFRHDENAWEEFFGSQAYDVLFTEMMTDPRAASEFVLGIMPQELLADRPDVVKEIEEAGKKIWAGAGPAVTDVPLPDTLPSREMTREELMAENARLRQQIPGG